jgi:hypothetical protein
MSFRFRDGAQRFQERRQRENEAPRLKATVPNLSSLRLTIEERRGSTALPESKHVKIVQVEHAPALFALTCGDSSCKDGGHDITHAVLRHLQSGATDFDVEDECSGSIGTAHCGRIMHVHGAAVYS